MKSNNDSTNTLTFKLWKYFITYAILIFVILWFMQVIFLQSYYSQMKKSEVVKLSNEIEKEYLKGNYTETVDKIAYKNASAVVLFDLSGNIIYASSGNNMISGNNLQVPARPLSINMEEVIDKMKKSFSNNINYTVKLDRFKTEIFIYGRKIKDTDACVCIVSSIDPVDATTNVLKSQLIYVTAISLVVSVIVSIFLSRRISHPIQEITSTASKLAKGNYDIEFKKAGYKEIDELADTLNYATKELAQTDKVRKELIANVSHDLKTPLTMIKAYSEMIRDLSR